ncbi:Rossmann-like domain-containing protein [Saccharibacillus endophyticus]|uniref:Putative heavy-metal chelation domain-containing protein n=1 Tax=Saccharibacillus endophyticus TaxID=2060666 RepID=A0ABQ1ZQ05_9BACL|nr:DUF364 domain-containing protein [Saccharibacillus endophyticus]GGH73710.1 hypothetical protein GCM10007362_13080 [Saccharibacillus endophyticus]
MNLIRLQEAVLRKEFGPDPEALTVTGAVSMYQTTQFPGSSVKYHNHYVLLRVEEAFGACSHMPEQLTSEVAEQCSGRSVAQLLQDHRLPVRIAAMDAYLGAVRPHRANCKTVVGIKPGTPLEKAKQRDLHIADTARIASGSRIALIGVVNPLVEAIVQRGGICLPCDLQMEHTQWGQPVEKDMNIVLEQADGVICTGMTLSNGSFDLILEKAKQRGIPLTVYAQTGSAIVAAFYGKGVSALVAEPFPFTQFSGGTSELFIYD